MLPSLSITASSSSSPSGTATMRVNKATSELLVAPDWSLNIDICDFCNSNHWLAKDVVKEVKRRLQHKNPKVQLLTLTLLETMIKNCGEYIHYHIAERKVLDEMVKLVKKKADMHVREKILMLLDSWQEAFGGPSGKYTQYFWACDELRRCGVNFPQRSPRSAPVITPPARPSRVAQVGSGMPANSSQRLDAAMSSEVDSLSNSTLESMQNALELLDDMLEAVNPNDRMSVKDEVIVELADRCRTNQKKLMEMVATTMDEKLLAQGLEMNDSLQNVLARHDGIASGSPLPSHKKNDSILSSNSPDSNVKATVANDKTPVENGKSPVSDPPVSKTSTEEDEEDDGFALLARRHTKAHSAPSQNGAGSTEDATSSSGSNNALVLFDAPTPSPTTNDAKEQDIIGLLSLVLTTSSTSSETSPAPSSASAPNSAPAQNEFESSFNNYVVPWAQPQQMTQSSSMPQLQTQYQPMQSQMPIQYPQGYTQYSPAYPPPPWELTSSYGHNQIPAYNNPYLYQSSQVPMNNYSAPMQGSWSPQNVYSQYGNPAGYSIPASTNSSPLQGGARTLQQSNSFHNPQSTNGDPHSVGNGLSSSPMQGGNRSLQHVNSFPAKVGNSPAMNGSTRVLNNVNSGVPSSGQKPFIPSYRLFEDLNVLGGSEGKLKSGPYPSASGTRI